MQREIVKQAISMLKPGGMMIYSTCTFSPEENEQIIAWVLREFPEMQLIPMKGYEGFSEGRTGSCRRQSGTEKMCTYLAASYGRRGTFCGSDAEEPDTGNG